MEEEEIQQSIGSSVIEIEELMELLPHRYPFLLVDKILSYDLDKMCIIAQKNVTMNEHFFSGHFPGRPIMPGVLILEALAQAAGALFGMTIRNNKWGNKLALFLSVSKAKFRNQVRPGDVLSLSAELSFVSIKGGKAKGQAFVGSKLAAEAEYSFALVDK